MPSSAASSWRILLPLAAVLLLALIWSIYWLVASSVATTRFNEERARLAAQGITLSCSAENWGGYPFHFEFICSSPVVTFRDRAELGSSKLLLTALAYAPWQIVALVDGPSDIAAAGIPSQTVSHERAIAAITFDRERKLRLSAEIPAVSVPGHGAASRIMMHTRPSAESGTDLAISIRDVSIQQPGKPALVIGEGEFLGTLSADSILKVDSILLAQNAVRYWGSGAVELDTSNRPSGKLDTQTNDLDGLLAILEPHLELTPEEKSGLRAILGLLGNGSRTPLIARDGLLYLGPFKIAELKPLY
jgi:hypothetical protein